MGFRPPTLVRILLLEMTGIAADIIRHVVVQHSDIEIVDRDPGHSEPPDVDLVIAMHSSDRSAMRELDRVLTSKPGLCALTVEERGGTALLYRLVPQTTELGPLSPETLVEFIRGARAR